MNLVQSRDTIPVQRIACMLRCYFLHQKVSSYYCTLHSLSNQKSTYRLHIHMLGIIYTQEQGS